MSRYKPAPYCKVCLKNKRQGCPLAGCPNNKPQPPKEPTNAR